VPAAPVAGLGRGAAEAAGLSSASAHAMAAIAAAAAAATTLVFSAHSQQEGSVGGRGGVRCEVDQSLGRHNPNQQCEACHSHAEDEGHRWVLSADCGGTTTRLQIYRVALDAPIVEKQVAPGILLFEEKFPNLMFKSLEDIIANFLNRHCRDTKPTVAVLAVAGIVTNNCCRYTNLDWVVDGGQIAKDLGIGRVEVINDFVAQGYGTLTLNDEEVEKLNDVQPRRGSPIACIGAGTGLGQCFLISDASGDYRCYPSEGGHAEFAPRGEGSEDTQLELLKYLKVKFSGWNRISIERVVSGKGICNVYEFLAYTFPQRVDKTMHREFLKSQGNAGVIAKNATEGSLCQEALDIFASCYGAQCGSMAIQLMPFRGLFITGGVSKKLAHIFADQHGEFMSAYTDKGRVSPLLEQVPLFLVKNDDMGQRGAHLRAVRLLKEHVSGQEQDCRHCSESMDREHLVAPRSLVYGGEGSSDAIQMAALALEVSEFQARNRRMAIAPSDVDMYEPAFKTKLWRVVRAGFRMHADDWLLREMWISKNGCLCYRSKTTGESLVYWTNEDLAKAEIQPIDDSDTCRPYSFGIQPPGFQRSVFAASSAEMREVWMQHLRELHTNHHHLEEHEGKP